MKVFTTVGIKILIYLSTTQISAQKHITWVADFGNGTYKNPILHTDYSDPDVCRVGNDYYMTASSFNCVPGLPILHSTDLVNWNLIGYALHRQVPIEHFSNVQHGGGVWAPSISYHKGEYWIYYPDPDFGIYLVKSKNPKGPWTDPILVASGKGLIDPCPLWDDDGKVYLVYAYAGSRAGIKSVLAIKKMNVQGTKTIDEGVIVYDGHEIDPTIEGPKIYKRNGYYYIFAPAGGVSTGWQVVLRAKNIYGPYERKIVMEQGATAINGPHQGAWVNTVSGEDWFIHFQDKGTYGRIVHLQPMKWINNWPVIGSDPDKDGIGNPVQQYKKPSVAIRSAIVAPPESDEFNNKQIGLQWQWHANPQATWAMANYNGSLRLYTQKIPEQSQNLWDVPNLLLQKWPAESFTVTTKLQFTPNEKLKNEKMGLLIMGKSYSYLALQSTQDGLQLVHAVCNKAHQKGKESLNTIATYTKGSDIYLRVIVDKGAICSYSLDNNQYTPIESTFTAEPGMWIGAKVGLFATRDDQTNDAGYGDIDWFRFSGRVD
ncbi:MAG TPA: glycoside hydrolase 43 family protein [Saprospiraceae bacterium]|nr:glycoside hydrolase 43 family protein [Saprospiraceae bacterium]